MTEPRNAPSHPHPRRLRSALTIAPIVAASFMQGAASHAQSASDSASRGAGEIHFIVSVANNRGRVACALFSSTGWLESSRHNGFAKIEKRRARCVFRGVAPGVYAISAFHDENSNGRLDTNFLGIPTESWCASRDAKGFMGPPSFEDAKFRYAGGKRTLRGRM